MIQTAETAVRRYTLSPLTYFAGFYVPQIIMLPLIYLRYVPERVDPDAYLLTFAISMLYMACITGGFFLAPHVCLRIAHRFFAAISLRYSGNGLTPKDYGLLCKVLTLLFLCAFAIHMVVSGGGLLWITNSRQAYATYRIGVGPTYGLCLIFLYLSMIFSLFSIPLASPPRKIIRQIVGRTCIFSGFAYFLGSKGYIINLVIIGMIFYNYNVRPVRLKTLLLFGFVTLFVILGLLFVQGTSASAEDTASYADYYHNTSEFLRRFDEFGGYRWGGVMLSEIWGYVPRALYPNKPYEYGAMILDQLLYPGAAETGYTPAFLPWTANYLDFGLLGVAVMGIYNGIYLGWMHTFYATQPPSLIRFVLLIQLGFMGVFPFIPSLGIHLVVLPLFCAAVRGCQTILICLKQATLHQALTVSGRMTH